MKGLYRETFNYCAAAGISGLLASMLLCNVPSINNRLSCYNMRYSENRVYTDESIITDLNANNQIIEQLQQPIMDVSEYIQKVENIKNDEKYEGLPSAKIVYKV